MREGHRYRTLQVVGTFALGALMLASPVTGKEVTMASYTADLLPTVHVAGANDETAASDSTCRLCSQAQMPDSAGGYWVHFWHMDYCGVHLHGGGGDSCRICPEEAYCNDPLVAHGGVCPENRCGGGGAFALEQLKAGNAEWLVQQVAGHPDSYGFDPSRSAFQVYGCDGTTVVLDIVVDVELARILTLGEIVRRQAATSPALPAAKPEGSVRITPANHREGTASAAQSGPI